MGENIQIEPSLLIKKNDTSAVCWAYRKVSFIHNQNKLIYRLYLATCEPVVLKTVIFISSIIHHLVQIYKVFETLNPNLEFIFCVVLFCASFLLNLLKMYVCRRNVCLRNYKPKTKNTQFGYWMYKTKFWIENKIVKTPLELYENKKQRRRREIYSYSH